MAEVLELVGKGEDEEAADPVTPGLALALDGATADPGLRDPIARFLAANERLISDQRHHMRLKHFSEVLKVALQMLTVGAVLAVLVGVGVLVANAMNSRSVVVETFKSAPVLAARGLSGEVVAAAVMDRLSTMQDQTRYDSKDKLHVAGAWSSDIKLEVPETGMSLGELSRLLRGWLGHDTVISGDLVQEPDGQLSLTVRGDGIPPKTVTGPADTFDHLTVAAAEHLFGKADPEQFATYLRQQLRFEDMLKVLRDYYPHAKPGDRPVLLNVEAGVLNALGRFDEGSRLFRQSIAMNPDEPSLYLNLIATLRRGGHEEEAYQAMKARLAAIARLKKTYPPGFGATQTMPIVQDWMTYLEGVKQSAARTAGRGGDALAAPGMFANAYANLHDWNAGEQALLSAEDGDPGEIVGRGALEGRRALEEGRPADAIEPLKTAVEHQTRGTETAYSMTNCWLGLAYELTDQPDKAEAAFKGPTMAACEAFRADGMEHRGDHAGADAGYAKAVAIAPDLPYAYERWGLALLARGDLNGAAAKFAAANARGPRWADPLKDWGDVLVRQGKAHEAAAKYAEALKLAPNWQALQAAAAKVKGA